jgi:hypothetical protein
MNFGGPAWIERAKAAVGSFAYRRYRLAWDLWLHETIHARHS